MHGRQRNSATGGVESLGAGADDADGRQPLVPRTPDREPAASDGSGRRTGEAAFLQGSGLAASARDRLVLREVNDQIAKLVGAGNETGVSLFVCECRDRSCAEALEITAAEYERIRADEANFVVFPGHEQAESERVVERLSRFVIVANTEPDGRQAGASEGRRNG